MVHYYFVFLGIWRPFIAIRQDKLSQNGGWLNKRFIKGFESLLWRFYAVDPPFGAKMLMENDKRFQLILKYHIPIKFLLLVIMGCEIMYYDKIEDEVNKRKKTIK